MRYLELMMRAEKPLIRPPTQKKIMEIVKVRDNCWSLMTGMSSLIGDLKMDHA